MIYKTLMIRMGNKTMHCHPVNITPKTLRRFLIGCLDYLEWYNPDKDAPIAVRLKDVDDDDLVKGKDVF